MSNTEELYTFFSIDIFVNEFINKNILDKVELIDLRSSYIGWVKETPAYILKNGWIIFSQSPKSIECMYGNWRTFNDKPYFDCEGGYLLFHFYKY